MFRAVLVVGVCVGGAMLGGGSLAAQSTSIQVGGSPFSCVASNGQQVVIYSLPGAAQAARPLGGARADFTPQFGYTIAIDPEFIYSLPPLAALLVMYHECAHTALPMGVGLQSPYQELNADCFAIRQMVGQGLITSWTAFDQATASLVGSLAGHRFDQPRLQRLAQCAA